MANRSIAATLLIVVVQSSLVSLTESFSVRSVRSKAYGRKSFPSRLHVSSRRGDNKAPVDDAARLYQTLASREAKRRRHGGLDEIPRFIPKENVAAKPMGNGGGEQQGRVRLRLQRLDDSRPATKTTTKTKPKGKSLGAGDSKVSRSKMEAELNRLKLRLAEARREAEEGERRAKEAERRAAILSEGLTSPFPASSKKGEDTVESIRRDSVALARKVKSDNRRRLQEFEAASGKEKRALRNRAWSIETELNKQQYIYITARKEAEKATQLKNEVEARLSELEKRYSLQLATLEQEATERNSLLARTRRRIAQKMVSMRLSFQSDIQRRKEHAQAQEELLKKDMASKVRALEEGSQNQLLVLRREMVDAIAKEKKEKYNATRVMREEYKYYSTNVEGQIRAVRESAEDRVRHVQQETERRLEEATITSEEERKAIQGEGERALAEATSEAARQIDKLRKEINKKLDAEESDRSQLWEELAGRQAAMAKFEQERSSLGKIARLVRKVLRKRLHFRRHDD